MTDTKDAVSARDFKTGVPWADLPDGGTIAGRVDGDEVVLARRGDRLFAVGAHCTHYHGPLKMERGTGSSFVDRVPPQSSPVRRA